SAVPRSRAKRDEARAEADRADTFGRATEGRAGAGDVMAGGPNRRRRGGHSETRRPAVRVGGVVRHGRDRLRPGDGSTPRRPEGGAVRPTRAGDRAQLVDGRAGDAGRDRRGVLTPLLFAMARGTRTEAARIVRYGSEYLGRGLRGKGSATTRVARRLGTMRRGGRVGLVLSYAVGAALLSLAVVAAVRCVDQMPAGAPSPARLAAARDVVLVGSAALLWLLT